MAGKLGRCFYVFRRKKYRDPRSRFLIATLKVTQKASWILRADMTMRLVKYRIKSSTLALFPVDGHYEPLTVPAGSIVTINDGLLNENKLVEVTLRGKTVRMFAQDVRSRGEEVVE